MPPSFIQRELVSGDAAKREAVAHLRSAFEMSERRTHPVTRHARRAIIPLYDDLRSVLARIPKYSTTILTNSHWRAWKPNGFGTAFNRAKITAGMAERDLHFHDLRGTTATKFYVAGLSERVVAEIMGWQEEYVAKIIRRYVGRAAATKAVIRQLNQAKKRT